MWAPDQIRRDERIRIAVELRPRRCLKQICYGMICTRRAGQRRLRELHGLAIPSLDRSRQREIGVCIRIVRAYRMCLFKPKCSVRFPPQVESCRTQVGFDPKARPWLVGQVVFL